MNKIIATVASIVLGTAAASVGADVAPNEVTFEDGAVSASLTEVAGDAVRGRDAFANRKLGNCLACHTNSEMPEQLFHGQVAPTLDGAGGRWSEAELRGIVSNSKMTFDGTIMPAFYVDSGLSRPLKGFEGVPILTAQQVEDVVAYLITLK